MVGLPNLFPHPDGAVDMPPPPILWREIISNSRDNVIAKNLDGVAELNVTAGGTFVLSVTNRYAKQLIRLTGTPGASFTVEMADGNKQMEFENVTGQTATIDSATGAASPPTVAAGTTKLVHLRGIEFTTLGIVGTPIGAFLHDGSVDVTGDWNWLDFELARARFKDTSLVVTTPSSSAGALTLDMVNGNVFEVTLTEAVTTLNLNNPPASGKLGIITLLAKQDGTGTWAITWPAAIKWEQATGTSPAQSTGANAVDIYSLITLDAGTIWYGFVMGLEFA